MLNSWFLPSIIALILYGLWGFLGAQASQLTNAKTVFVVSCIGTAIAGALAIPLVSTRLELTSHSMALCLLTGLVTGVGTLMFMNALQKGPVIPIIMITALYPMVTVLLAMVFLSQPITFKQVIGIILSLFAIYYLTIP